MKKQTLIIFFSFFFFKNTNAENYSLAFLNDSIKKNANAIIWKFDHQIIINKDLSFTEKVHKVVTILNKKGDEQAIYYGYESKEISSVLKLGKVYDENGVPFKKIKKSDLNTIGEYSQFISDIKADYYNPEISKYPFTVEYEFETKYHYLLYLPEFSPFLDYNIAVLNASYKIQVPENLGLRFYNQNNTWKSISEIHEKVTTYTFEINNNPCINEELNAPEFDKIAPRIIIAPNQISYYGYKSKFEDWNDFGKWIIQLNNQRDSLPIDVKIKMQQYKINYPNLIERAKVIYNWMQDNTRYYSIQLGLGGFQPMKTLDVNKNKYGDCKALSFFTKTLFKEAGIDAYYTLVNAGKNKGIIKDFPANQFNHVIVCLPIEKDTIWLECTDQKIPFGYLGTFTDDRDVLVINDKPSIVHTKNYSVNENIKTITANIIMSEQKMVQGNIIYSTKGLQTEDLYKAEYLPSNDLQKKYLYELLNVNNLKLINYTIENDKSIIPQKTLNSNFEISNFVTTIGSKLVIQPNIFTKYYDKIKIDTNRILPIEQDENFTEIDSITFTLPKNYFIENNSNIHFESKFGNYSMQIIFNKLNNTILYTRKLVINKGVYAALEQKEYVGFIKNIISADNTKLLLKNSIQ